MSLHLYQRLLSSFSLIRYLYPQYIVQIKPKRIHHTALPYSFHCPELFRVFFLRLYSPSPRTFSLSFLSDIHLPLCLLEFPAQSLPLSIFFSFPLLFLHLSINRINSPEFSLFLTQLKSFSIKILSPFNLFLFFIISLFSSSPPALI